MKVNDYRIKRIAHNIKLKEVAEAIGISAPHLCRFEKGHVMLGYELVRKYKKYIDEMVENAQR
jgi:transcriptional regulator with XRE-family HTH domain